MAETQEQARTVNINPRAFENSLYDLFSMYKRAPDADANKIHSLDFNIWEGPCCVGAAIVAASDCPSVGKGKQELSRYVMLDTSRMMLPCEELSQVRLVGASIRSKIKLIESRTTKRDLNLELKNCAKFSYHALTPCSSTERYHLWAWDDANMKELLGMLGDTELPRSILAAFAAGSLATLEEPVLGAYVAELREEYQHGLYKIGRLLDNLSDIKEHVDAMSL